MKFKNFIIIFIFSVSKSNCQYWSTIPPGVATNSIKSLYNYNGNMLIGGDFLYTPGNTTVLSYNGFNLSQYSPLIPGQILSMAAYNNDLMVGGVYYNYSIGWPTSECISGYDGSNWYHMANGITDLGRVMAMASYQSSLFIGGNFDYVDSVPRKCIARWDGTLWHSVGSGLSGGLSDIEAMAVYNGELYIGGYFSSIDGVTAYNIAKFNGSTWSPIGTGTSGSVRVLLVDSVTNRLYVAGNFNYANGLNTTTGIVYFDGTNWFSAPSGPAFYPNALAIYQNQLYAGFYQKHLNNAADSLCYIARWDGNDWQPLDKGTNATVTCLMVYNNELIIGGYFTQAGDSAANRIARWYYNPNSVTEIEKNTNTFSTQPNPAQNSFTLVNHGSNQFSSAKVLITDAMGKEYYNNEINFYEGHFTFDIKFPSGTYVIKINEVNKSTQQLKLIIQH